MRTSREEQRFEAQTYTRVTRRLMPLLLLSYVLAYLDRVNVGFAKLQMQSDLGFTDTIYGIGAGIFFIGYFVFEVPSNLVLQRVGARIWIARIMIVWGLLAAATLFTRSETVFYVLRFLLGAAEAGFFPGVILYLTYWYPRAHRARIMSLLLTALVLSGVVGGPLSGWIMVDMAGKAGLAGWQWLYLLEGMPAVLVGIFVLLWLDDGPQRARWLSSAQKELLLRKLEEEQRLKISEGHASRSFGDAFRSRHVWLLCVVYFGIVMGLYGISFWLPQIIQDTITRDVASIGLISVIPWAVAAIAMLLNARHSDRTGERRWHVAVPALIGALAFAASGLPGLSGWLGLMLLSVATAGVMAAVSTFWTFPTAILSGTAAAAGIAWINSVGNLAGYASPYIVGRLRDTSQSMGSALVVLALSLCVAALVVIFGGFARRSGK